MSEVTFTGHDPVLRTVASVPRTYDSGFDPLVLQMFLDNEWWSFTIHDPSWQATIPNPVSNTTPPNPNYQATIPNPTPQGQVPNPKSFGVAVHELYERRMTADLRTWYPKRDQFLIQQAIAGNVAIQPLASTQVEALLKAIVSI